MSEGTNVVKCAWCGALTVKVISLSKRDQTLYQFCCLNHRDAFWENLQGEVSNEVREESCVSEVRSLVGYKGKDGNAVVYRKEPVG